MQTHHPGFCAALLLALSMPLTLVAADPNAPVDPQGVQLQAQEQNGIRYLQGGIGQDEANALRRTPGYNLHITLSTGPEGKFQRGASLVIESAQGNQLLALQDVGPLIYVQLPPGHYRVAGSADGQTVQQQVTVDGKAPARVDLNWR
ncbi:MULTISPECIES: carboxypeptidase regulatory-like domain-containing protein [unclassified Pseudomonas]|uniref:carboxypeptidase regulatory-like domain-containing protein n=1 Tax=unclassified Pseudomonas TaxID=196821 RepID=UPI00244D3D0A|nr:MULTISPECIES: carboxypeptidase regulatory-like domain-containing protein [unclassified Pseudomonas]MDH0301920.1 carboxypeptidase regulatory-like domain-containing protein [Pseudomonas sp. GD04091]MDH1983792.1 carboxypeptidase regulatory-like domain-containing protein [Pseudomonas sp. GD03689]